MEISISIKDLKPFQIKSHRKSKNPHGKCNGCSIYATTQGVNKEQSINIDFRDTEFLDYANINIYCAFGKLFFELSHKYHVDSHRLSINRRMSQVSTVKISNRNDIQILLPFVGEWDIQKMDGEDETVYMLKSIKRY